MANLESIKEIQQLLWVAYSRLISLQIEDEENFETQKEVLNDINEIYKKLREDFNVSLWGEVE